MAETAVATESSAWAGGNTVEDLEHRVQRLEDVVAALCDTKAMEERLYARLLERHPTPPLAPPPSSQPETLPPLHTDGQTPEHMAASLRGTVARGLLTVATSAETMSLAGEVWWDLRAAWQMIRDPFYKMSWMARLIGLLPAAYLLWSTLAGFHNGVPFVGYLIDIILFLPFLYVTFKAWGRELRRYRDFTARQRGVYG